MTGANLAFLLGGAAAVSFVLALALTPQVRRIALRTGFVDRPSAHKSHRDPTPYGGGVAIFIAAWLPLTVALLAVQIVPLEWVVGRFGEILGAYAGGIRLRASSAAVILGGGLALHILGLIDDRRALGAIAKLFVIGGVSALTAWVGGVRLAEFAGRELAIVLTTLWMIVIINAFNFLDNMDGLSSGVALICLGFFVACGLMSSTGQVLVPALGCVFFGAVAGFWIHNFPPARIFMGDAGSLLIGYMLAVISVLTTYHESGTGTPPYALAMPLVVLAVPLYDFVTVVWIRLSEGRSPLKGDQRHFSHRLVEHGLSRRQAVLTIYLATLTTGSAATLLPLAGLRQTITVGVLVIMVLAIIAILETPPRREA